MRKLLSGYHFPTEFPCSELPRQQYAADVKVQAKARITCSFVAEKFARSERFHPSDWFSPVNRKSKINDGVKLAPAFNASGSYMGDVRLESQLRN
jgi:hypothetical protein